MEAEERSREEAHHHQQHDQAADEQEDTEMQASGEADVQEEEGDVLYYVDADGNKIEPQDMQDFALASAEDIIQEEQEVNTNGQQQQDALALMVDEEHIGDSSMQIEPEHMNDHRLAHSQLQSTSEAFPGVERVQTQLEAETGEADSQAQEAARFERPFKPRTTTLPSTATSTSTTSNGYSSDTEESQKPDFKLRYILTGHRKNVSSIKFSPDGKYLITAGGDGGILLYSLPAPPPQPPVASTSSSSSSTSSLKEFPQAPTFIRSYTIPTPAPIKLKPPRTSSSIPPVGCSGINDLSFSPCSKYFATASDDNLVRIWKVDPFPRDKDILDDSMKEEMEKNGDLPTAGAEGGVTASAQSNGGHGLPLPNGIPANANVNGHTNDAILPSSALSRAAEHPIELKGHTSFVFCVAFTPQGNLLASGSYDESIRIWDVKRGKCLKILPAHSDPVAAVGFSGDGSILCSAGHDGLLRLWDTASGQCLKSLVDESHPPASHALFTPNSRYALVSSLDSTIRLWDYHAAVCVKTYKAHENVKFHIPAIFHLPSKGKTGQAYIITGSEDGRIVFYDLQSRDVALTLPGHKSDPILCLALDPHSGMLATSARERGVDEYQTKLWVDVSRSRTRSRRPLTNGSSNGR